MARYRKIDVRIWSDSKVKALSKPQPNAQTLWFFLLTGPHTTQIPGLFQGGEAGLAEAIGWPIKAFQKAFLEVSEAGMVEASWPDRVVWIPNAINYNQPESPNVVKGWATAWHELPECDIKLRAWNKLRELTEDIGEAFGNAFLEACRQPSPNQEQEQEQEQEVSSKAFDERLATRRVFDAWRVETGHTAAKFDVKRRDRIRARLREGFSEEDLMLALKGWRLDPWCQGRHEKNTTVYSGVETIFRDAGQVEKFIRFAKQGKPDGVVAFSPRPMKTAAEIKAEQDEETRRLEAEMSRG